MNSYAVCFGWAGMLPGGVTVVVVIRGPGPLLLEK